MANGRSRFTWILIAMLLLASGAACASSVFVFIVPLFSDPAEARPVLVTPRGALAPAERSTVELFRNASPSVVYITSIAVRQDAWSRNIEEIPEGTGSGFVWDERGHIVTNFHVIANAQAARVTLSDQSTWDATLVGAVAEKDLAVLRIDAPRTLLRPLPIGTSSDLAVGQSVFAIGNPFGLDHTLSTGVVSGLDREIMGIGGRPILGMVQTDAAINPGNSGGPLLDSAGRLIGLNTAIHSPSGASAGIGFAIPVDTVRSVVPQLIEHHRVIRPALGVHIADPRMVQGLRARGALVMQVDPNSPAAQAGLRPTRRDQLGRIYLGDLIVGIDGAPVSEPNDIYRVLDRHAVGDRVRVTLDRGGDLTEVQIELVGVAAE